MCVCVYIDYELLFYDIRVNFFLYLIKNKSYLSVIWSYHMVY